MKEKYQGLEVEPFYPKHFRRHLLYALGVIAGMVLLALFGIQSQQETEPVFTSMVPQPDWLFFLIFQATRYLRGGWQDYLATLIIPLLIFLGLFLVPLLDRKGAGRKKLRGAIVILGIVMALGVSVLTFHTSSTTPIWGCTACHKEGFGTTFSDAPAEVNKFTFDLDNKWLAVHYQYPQYWWMFNADQDPPRW